MSKTEVQLPACHDDESDYDDESIDPEGPVLYDTSPPRPVPPPGIPPRNEDDLWICQVGHISEGSMSYNTTNFRTGELETETGNICRFCLLPYLGRLFPVQKYNPAVPPVIEAKPIKPKRKYERKNRPKKPKKRK